MTGPSSMPDPGPAETKDFPFARGIETKVNAASHGRQKRGQKKRRAAECRSDTEILEPTAMRRTSQRAKGQLFKYCPTRPADQRRGNQNRSMPRGKGPVAVG